MVGAVSGGQPGIIAWWGGLSETQSQRSHACHGDAQILDLMALDCAPAAPRRAAA